MMSSRYPVFCVILFFIALGLGFKNYETWSQSSGAIVKREIPKKPEGKGEALPPAPVQKEMPPREQYKAIAEKNIFHPDRKEFPVVGTEQTKPAARPQISLFGVVVTGDYQSATIVNPGRPLVKGEREAKTVKVGDRVGDYKVAKILEDRIVMESGEDSFEVLLYDPGAPKKRMEVRAPAQPVTVTSAAGGTAPASVPGGIPAPMPQAATSPSIPMKPPAMGPTPGAAQMIPSPPVSPPGMTPRTMESSPGTTPQPSGPQPSVSTPTTPNPGIWRSRRPLPSGTQPGTQGN